MDVFRKSRLFRLRFHRLSLNFITSFVAVVTVLIIVINEEDIQLMVRSSRSPFRAIWTPDKLSDFEIIDFKKAIESKDLRHGCHAFIYALDKRLIFNNFPIRAKIMMHMRIDGYLGFPGGLVESGETMEEALNRELTEELALGEDYAFTAGDHAVSYVHRDKGFVDHMYAKRVTSQQFDQIEQNIRNSREYGLEIFGPIRVPLFILEDGYRGLPNFMTNKFVGNSLQELIYCIIKTGIMSPHEVHHAVRAVHTFNASVNLNLQIPTF